MTFPCRIFAALLATVTLSVQAESKAPVSVDFTLHAPGLPGNSKVYISGDVPALGDWTSDPVRMEHVGHDTWHAVVVFKSAMLVEYQYNLGSDERIAADDRGQPLGNFTMYARRNLEVEDEVFNWTNENTVIEARGQVTGELRYHRHVRNDTLPPKDLAVWLPRYYEMQEHRDYPVLYLNDGQDLFDPATAENGRDWGIDETMTRLIADGQIEPMIVVGIFSDEDRLAEYSPMQRGEEYMDFIVNTVKPLIDRRYRTRSGPENTLVGGAAMGGLIAFATAWTYPKVFGAALSFSPAFQLEGRLDALPWFDARAGAPRPVFFYLDVGGVGADALLVPGVEAMVDRLKGWGYRPERNFVFIHDLDADHDVSAWSERFPNALMRSLRGARRIEDYAVQGEEDSGEEARDPETGLAAEGSPPAFSAVD